MGMKNTLALDKKSLRARVLAARAALDPAAAQGAAKALARHLRAAITENNAIIAGYNATRGEIDLSPFLGQLTGHTLCLPVVEAADKPLVFRRWRFGQALEAGQYGIGISPASEPLLVPDVVIVPLLAFDAEGHRLGYGAGYYDRTIAGLREGKKSVTIIGAAFAMQQVGHIPADAHDMKLDAVVTEKGLIKFK